MNHGESYTRLYNIWRQMKARCNNSKHRDYYKYGGRGIKVCEDWNNNFIVFKKWSEENGYDDSLTIDRIDVNKGYNPDNCRWVDYKIQNNNKRDNVYITINGETKTAMQWSELSGIPFTTLMNRYKKGWSENDLLKKKDKYIYICIETNEEFTSIKEAKKKYPKCTHICDVIKSGGTTGGYHWKKIKI